MVACTFALGGGGGGLGVICAGADSDSAKKKEYPNGGDGIELTSSWGWYETKVRGGGG